MSFSLPLSWWWWGYPPSKKSLETRWKFTWNRVCVLRCSSVWEGKALDVCLMKCVKLSYLLLTLGFRGLICELYRRLWRLQVRFPFFDKTNILTIINQQFYILNELNKIKVCLMNHLEKESPLISLYPNMSKCAKAPTLRGKCVGTPVLKLLSVYLFNRDDARGIPTRSGWLLSCVYTCKPSPPHPSSEGRDLAPLCGRRSLPLKLAGWQHCTKQNPPCKYRAVRAGKIETGTDLPPVIWCRVEDGNFGIIGITSWEKKSTGLKSS